MEIKGIERSGTREISEGMHWIQECIVREAPEPEDGEETPSWYDRGDDLHGCQNAYLIDDEQTLLFDTLTQASTDHIIETVDDLLDGRPLDYLVISHPESNHAGNTFPLIQEYPEMTVIAPEYGADHEQELYHLDEGNVRYVREGDGVDLGDHEVTFHKPHFYDHSMHVWMSESTTETLYPVDWLGYQHIGGDCLKYASELSHPLAVNQLLRFNSYAFPWLAFANTDKTDDAVDEIIEKYDPEMIAPAHGQVITEDASEHIELMKEVMHRIREKETVSVRDNLGDVHV